MAVYVGINEEGESERNLKALCADISMYGWTASAMFNQVYLLDYALPRQSF